MGAPPKTFSIESLQSLKLIAYPPNAFRPVDHEVLESGILRLDGLDPLDDVRRRAAEPGLLLDAVGERRHARGRARRAPRAAVLVRVAHEAERREPLVALVV